MSTDGKVISKIKVGWLTFYGTR